MQVGCEIASAGGRCPPPVAQPQSHSFKISRQSGRRGLRMNFPPSSGFFFLFCLPQPLTICLSGSSLPLLRLNAKLAVAKQPLREERFRWGNSNSYILFYALRMSAY